MRVGRFAKVRENRRMAKSAGRERQRAKERKSERVDAGLGSQPRTQNNKLQTTNYKPQTPLQKYLT